MSEEKTYAVQARCTNCGWRGDLEINKGTTIQEEPCPNCECKSTMMRVKGAHDFRGN